MSWTTFQDQPQAAAVLHNSIRNGRVAHAYLLSGGEGNSLKRLAVQFAKSLMCVEQNGDSCGRCSHCLRIDTGNHPDFHRITPDGASIKIDQVRGLQKEFAFRAYESDRKIYLIEQAEKLTVQASNSLLKFLEEPHPQVVALLLTEHMHQILPTIVSRCQTVRLRELPLKQRIELLKQEGFFEPLVRNACQITADMEQARELCRAEWFAHFRNLVLQLSEDILDKGSYALVGIQDKILKNEQGNQGIPLILDLLIYWYRDVLFYQMNRHDELANIDCLDPIQRQALRCNRTWILKGMETVMETKDRLARHAHPQLCLERMVIQLQEG